MIEAEPETIESWLEEAVEAPDGRGAEEHLNKLIEERAKETEARERVDRELAEGVRRNDLGRMRELRKAWARHHQSLGQLHAQLAEEHREKAHRLIDEGA